MKPFKKLVCLLLFLSLGSNQDLFSQEYEQVLSISEWIAEMENSTEPYYHLTDTEIIFDEALDSLYAWWQPRSPEEDSISREDIQIKPMISKTNAVALSPLATSRDILCQESCRVLHMPVHYTEQPSHFIAIDCNR